MGLITLTSPLREKILCRSASALLALVLSLGGCRGNASRDEDPAGNGGTVEGHSADRSTATESGAAAPSGGTPEPARSPDDRGGDAGSDVDDAQLIEASEVFARTLASALGEGEIETARALAVTDEDLRSLMTEGGYRILSMVLGRNQKNLERYIEALGGSVSGFEWHHGTLGRTPTTIWSRSIPSMSNSVLTINPETSPLPVRIDQLVWIDGEWKILRLRR